MKRIFGVCLSLSIVLSGLSLISASDQIVADYETVSVKDNLPLFYESLKSKLSFPLSWNSGSFKDFPAWKKDARAKVLEHAMFPSSKKAFEPKIISEIDKGTYLARKVSFNISAESRVLALMLVPKGKGPFPAVLLLHDHGSKFDIGKEKMIEPWGDDVKAASAKAWSEKFFTGRFVGNELAAKGYAVLAVDAIGWGDRAAMTYEMQQALNANLNNLGSSLAGLMAYEDVRSAEFLSSFDFVKKDKLAALGFSMGAFRAWQTAALTDTVSAAVSICWMTTAKGVMVPGNNILRGQSSYWMIHPGLVRYLDYSDVASIACPKPVLFYNGEQDKLFPVDSVKKAYADMKKIWQSQKAESNFSSKLWPLGHVYVKEMQDESFAWLDAWVKKQK